MQQKEIIWETFLEHNGKRFRLHCDTIIESARGPLFIVEAEVIGGPFSQFMSATADEFEHIAFCQMRACILHAEGGGKLPPSFLQKCYEKWQSLIPSLSTFKI